jgi:hypothetical protein
VTKEKKQTGASRRGETRGKRHKGRDSGWGGGVREDDKGGRKRKKKVFCK